MIIENDEKLEEIEYIISTLDTLYEAGEETVNPITNKFVSDAEYDKLYGENGSERLFLKKNKPNSDIFKKVTASNIVYSAIRKIKHSPPLTSISKANGSIIEKQKRLGEWMIDCLDNSNIKHSFSKSLFELDSKGNFKKDPSQSLQNLSVIQINSTPFFVMSLKRDGCAIGIYFENGYLKDAGNRPNDGINAVSVLNHVKYLKGIPNSLNNKYTFSIRGEVECRLPDFDQVNDDAKTKGIKTYENPRNLTAGAMNPMGDPKVVAERKLSFTGHSIENFDNAPYSTVLERAIWVNKYLKIPFIQVRPFSYSELEKIENDNSFPDTLQFEIDGLIIEVNDLELANNLGRVGDRDTGEPRSKIAWKLPEKSANVEINNIRWGVGRSGRCVPVAEFNGVRLAGTTVKNCTIHNVGQLLANKIGIGAKIRIFKSGKIIPYWAETISPASNVEYPSNCPACNSTLVIKKGNDGSDLFCENTNCSAQQMGSMVHFLDNMGVKGISESIVTQLLSSGVIKEPADFYKLNILSLQKAGRSDREAVLDYARIHMVDFPEKEKDSHALLKKANLAASKKKVISLHNFIAALGIPGASKGTGKSLFAEFGSIDNILNASESDLVKSKDVGEKTAKVVYNWLKDNKSKIENLLNYIEIEQPKTGIFSGKTIVFTGTFPKSKEYWIKKVEDQGAKTSTSVSKKTNIVVWGPEAGQKKEKAEELIKQGHPVELIDIDDLQERLGEEDDRAF
jgi:DNA ligase (NAD+)